MTIPASEPVCPICQRKVAPAEENRAFPFCSGRCKLVDLGGWLDGRYRIAGEPVDDEGDDLS